MSAARGTSLTRLFHEESQREPEKGSLVRLRVSLWDRLSAIAAHETELSKKDPKPRVISRNDVIRRMLEQAVAGYEKDEQLQQSEKKRR